MKRRLLLGVLTGMTCFGLLSCADESSPEAQIERLIGQFEHAVESATLRDAAELVADDYRDDHHGNKAAAMRSLFAFTRHQRALHLFTLIDSIDVDGEFAAAVVHAAVTRVPVESREALVSLNADLYRFDIALSAADGDWLIQTARWQRVGADFLR